MPERDDCEWRMADGGLESEVPFKSAIHTPQSAILPGYPLLLKLDLN
jgi:hypothetical protein